MMSFPPVYIFTSVFVVKYFTGNLRKRKDAIAQNVPMKRPFKFMIFYLRNVPMGHSCLTSPEISMI